MWVQPMTGQGYTSLLPLASNLKSNMTALAEFHLFKVRKKTIVVVVVVCLKERQIRICINPTLAVKGQKILICFGFGGGGTETSHRRLSSGIGFPENRLVSSNRF